MLPESEREWKIPPLERDAVKALRKAIRAGSGELFKMVPLFVQSVLERELWKGAIDAHGRPFTSFKALVEAPLWEGMATPLHRVRDFCFKHPEVVAMIDGAPPELAEQGGDRKSPDAKDQGDDVTLMSRGNSTDYLTARLKRDRPDLLAEVAEGRMTVRAAARAAGIIKPPNALQDLRSAWKRATPDERAAFLDDVSGQVAA